MCVQKSNILEILGRAIQRLFPLEAVTARVHYQEQMKNLVT